MSAAALNQLPAASRKALATSLQKYGSALGQDWLQQALTRLQDGIKSILNPAEETRLTEGGGQKTVEVGDSPSTVRADLVSDLLKRFENGDTIAAELNIDFKIKTATSVAGNAGRFVDGQSNVDEFPAWALSRMYDRLMPRGQMRGPKDSIIEVPDDDWPSRWAEAGADCGDDQWLPWEGDSQEGRGVALKSSGIWEALGNLRDDSLGNPFPPFAFNSGFRCTQVDVKECIELGLLNENGMTGDEDGNSIKPRASNVDLENLFADFE